MWQCQRAAEALAASLEKTAPAYAALLRPLADAAPAALTRRTALASLGAAAAYFGFHLVAKAIWGPHLPAAPVQAQDAREAVQKAEADRKAAEEAHDDEAKKLLAEAADGDARRALNLLEIVADLSDQSVISPSVIEEVASEMRAWLVTSMPMARANSRVFWRALMTSR